MQKVVTMCCHHTTDVMAFIQSTDTLRMDCVFCGIVSRTIPARILSESQHAVAVLDAFPLALGHVLVLSKRHYQKIQDLQIEENTDLFALVHTMVGRVDSAMTGSTLIAIHNGREAGQEIPHLHVHIVPRNKGDSAGAIHSMFNPKKISDDETGKICDMLETRATKTNPNHCQ